MIRGFINLTPLIGQTNTDSLPSVGRVVEILVLPRSLMWLERERVGPGISGLRGEVGPAPHVVAEITSLTLK